MVILELIHANEIPLRDGRNASLRSQLIGCGRFAVRPSFVLVIPNNFMMIAWSSSTGDASFKCLPFELSMVGSPPTMVVTDTGESGFDSGKGA